MPDAREMEQEVRRRWEQVEDDGFAVIVVAGGTLHRFMGYKKRWPESYTFTLAHAQKIAELREEIAWVQGFVHMAIPKALCVCDNCAICRRIVARLDSQLQELLRGYKES